MEELLEALYGTKNVKSVTYNVETEQWIIEYKTGLRADKMPSSLLIDFLNNG